MEAPHRPGLRRVFEQPAKEVRVVAQQEPAGAHVRRRPAPVGVVGLLVGVDEDRTEGPLGLEPGQFFWFFLLSIGGIMSGAYLSGRMAGKVKFNVGFKGDDAKVETYVTHRALDGLFAMMADEEKAIRANPVAAGTDIVRKVFGALGK